MIFQQKCQFFKNTFHTLKKNPVKNFQDFLSFKKVKKKMKISPVNWSLALFPQNAQ